MLRAPAVDSHLIPAPKQPSSWLKTAPSTGGPQQRPQGLQLGLWVVPLVGLLGRPHYLLTWNTSAAASICHVLPLYCSVKKKEKDGDSGLVVLMTQRPVRGLESRLNSSSV